MPKLEIPYYLLFYYYYDTTTTTTTSINDNEVLYGVVQDDGYTKRALSLSSLSQPWVRRKLQSRGGAEPIQVIYLLRSLVVL